MFTSIETSASVGWMISEPPLGSSTRGWKRSRISASILNLSKSGIGLVVEMHPLISSGSIWSRYCSISWWSSRGVDPERVDLGAENDRG